MRAGSIRLLGGVSPEDLLVGLVVRTLGLSNEERPLAGLQIVHGVTLLLQPSRFTLGFAQRHLIYI